MTNEEFSRLMGHWSSRSHAALAECEAHQAGSLGSPKSRHSLRLPRASSLGTRSSGERLVRPRGDYNTGRAIESEDEISLVTGPSAWGAQSVRRPSAPATAEWKYRLTLQLATRVRDSPEDMECRLHYAYFSRKEHPEQAEFIERQLEMAEGNHDSAAFSKLVARVSELLCAHEAEFLGAKPEYVERWVFNRGFVEVVDLAPDAFADDGDNLLGWQPIQHLNLTELPNETFFQSPHLSTIRSIDMTGLRASDRTISELVRSPFLKNLRWLSLADNLVDWPGVTELLRGRSALPSIEWIDLRGNLCSAAELFEQVEGYITRRWIPEELARLVAVHAPDTDWFCGAATARMANEWVPARLAG